MVYTLSGFRLHSSPFLHKASGSSFHGDLKNSRASFVMRNYYFSRKIFAGKSSYDSDSPSSMVSASEKVLVPGGESYGSSSSADQLEVADSGLTEPQILHDVDSMKVDDDSNIADDDNYVQTSSGYSEVDNKEDSIPSAAAGKAIETRDDETSAPLHDISKEKDVVRQRSIPPPGIGQKIYEIDPFLRRHREHLDYRYSQYRRMREEINKHEGGLEAFSRGYEKFGFTQSATGITYREWAPGAKIEDYVFRHLHHQAQL